MSAPSNVYRKLREMPVDAKAGILRLDPGIQAIRVDKSDAMAAELMAWFEERYPETTVSDYLCMLDAARWWTILWSAMQEQEQETGG